MGQDAAQCHGSPSLAALAGDDSVIVKLTLRFLPAMDNDHLRDLFAGLPQLSIRRLFGGVGLYCDGRVFALGAFEQIWIKADAETVALFEAAGSAPFTYQGRTRTVKLPYWSLPDEALDDPDQALKWARLGLAASSRASKAPPRKRRAKAPRSTS